MSSATEHQLPLTAGDLMARPQCPICGSTARAHLRDLPYIQDTATHHFRCEGCGLVYMDPMPTQAWYDRLYGEEFWEVKSVSQSQSEIWTNKRQWHKGLARAEKYIDLLRKAVPRASIRSVLEIGASFGLIGTTVAEAYGARAFGVEPNHAARDFARRASGMVMVAESAAELDKWQADAPADLAIFSHVLENIIDLRSTLAAVHRKLNPGGLLLIETPNTDWTPSMSIYHPYSFSPEALRILLEQSGFRIKQVRRSGRPSSIVVPRYLTILAESVAAPPARETRQGAGNTASARLRHNLYRVFYKSGLGNVDYILAWKRFHETPFVHRGIAKLSANLARLKPEPEKVQH
jgi:SAM-dependent methyltransferase